MQKFEVMFKEVREAFIAIEANSAEEAEQLFSAKMLNDDYFCDGIYERLENGVVDEDIKATPINDYTRKMDYTYEEMTEEVE